MTLVRGGVSNFRLTPLRGSSKRTSVLPKNTRRSSAIGCYIFVFCFFVVCHSAFWSSVHVQVARQVNKGNPAVGSLCWRHTASFEIAAVRRSTLAEHERASVQHFCQGCGGVLMCVTFCHQIAWHLLPERTRHNIFQVLPIDFQFAKLHAATYYIPYHIDVLQTELHPSERHCHSFVRSSKIGFPLARAAFFPQKRQSQRLSGIHADLSDNSGGLEITATRFSSVSKKISRSMMCHKAR